MTDGRWHPPDNIIKRIRTDAGLTQEQLAFKLDVTKIYVIRLEQGLPPHISADIARELVRIQRLSNGTWTSANDIPEVMNTYMTERYLMHKEFFAWITSQPDYDKVVRRAFDKACDEFKPGVAVEPKSQRAYYHPHTIFRAAILGHYKLPVSQIKYCTYTGIHPAIINSLESGKIGISSDGVVYETLKSGFRVPEEIRDTLVALSEECVE